MAIESRCKLLARCSLTILLYFFLLSFRFNSSCGVIYSFLVAFFCAYKSRRLLFKSAFCSGDIAALCALSSSRLRSFGHVTILSMELDVFIAPIYNRKVRSQIKYRRTHIARTLIYYYIVMNHNWVAHYTFSSQIDNINEKTMYLGLDQVMHQSCQSCHFDLYIYQSIHLHIYNNMILTLASASYKHKKKISI